VCAKLGRTAELHGLSVVLSRPETRPGAVFRLTERWHCKCFPSFSMIRPIPLRSSIAALAVLALWVGGCSLNPQPLPPGGTDNPADAFEGVDGSAGTGSSSAKGAEDGGSGADATESIDAGFAGDSGSEADGGVNGVDGSPGDGTTEVPPDGTVVGDGSADVSADAAGPGDAGAEGGHV